MANKNYVSVLKYEDSVPIYTTKSGVINFGSNNKEIEVKLVEGVPGAYILTNVLSPTECQQFIDTSEKMGYDLATISTYGGMVQNKQTRNNKRVIWQSDISIWKPLWQRIRKFVCSELKLYGVKWHPYGLNERLRLYRYSQGEVFVRHYDGAFPRSSIDKSFLTVIFYLNDNFEGGNTTFFSSYNLQVPVQPQKGNALLFWHGSHPESPLHEGSLCTSGVKYVLRSDVMFVKEGEKPFVCVDEDNETDNYENE